MLRIRLLLPVLALIGCAETEPVDTHTEAIGRGGAATVEWCHYDQDAAGMLADDFPKDLPVTATTRGHARHTGDVAAGAWYVDADGDGYGDESAEAVTCPPNGLDMYADNNLDCDDTDADTWEDCCAAFTRADLEAWLANLDDPANWDYWDAYAYSYSAQYDFDGAPTPDDEYWCSQYDYTGHYLWESVEVYGYYSDYTGNEHGGSGIGVSSWDYDYTHTYYGYTYSAADSGSSSWSNDWYHDHAAGIYEDEYLYSNSPDPVDLSDCSDMMAEFADDNGLDFYEYEYTCGI